jgi:hypothetical protein
MKIFLNLLRRVLYGAAIAAGVAGLIAGGDPIARYVLDELRDYQYHDYYETSNYLQEPEIIFLLSMILLVGVSIAIRLDKGIQPASVLPAASSTKEPGRPAGTETVPPSGTAEVPTTPGETADEKLARLLNRNKN